MNQDLFAGTWKLISFELRSSDGQVTYPFGEEPVGYIIYNQDGFMSVAFMASERKEFASNDPQKGTVEEKGSAMDTFFSYCGRYEVQCDKIVHHIEVSLFPNWMGMKQERLYRFEGGRLTLSTPPFQVGGAEQTAHLIWERV
ncbi:MAG: lipocalin-like domain-containing protein [Planctomycetota bacterium]